MRVVVLTTSFPRHAGDVAGAFVADQVTALRAAGLELEVVDPTCFRDYGIAYGDGIVNNLRRAPWRAAALPLFLAGFARAARAEAADADVVHAHWLPCGLVAAKTGKPFVLQLWGTDAELARKVPRLVRPVVRAASVVVCASRALAEDARSLGARDVRVIPNGITVPAEVVPPEEPPHALYVGRLSEEKGIRELAEATAGLPLRVVGDGPLRALLPQTAGFVSPPEVGSYYDRAAVVVVPSRREGYGAVAREAMAHGRAIVATSVGGLADVVEDDVTGLLVPPRDPVALRAALERLLADATLRDRLGQAARARVMSDLSWDATVAGLTAAYRDTTQR